MLSRGRRAEIQFDYNLRIGGIGSKVSDKNSGIKTAPAHNM
jgi:hypothetical protein